VGVILAGLLTLISALVTILGAVGFIKFYAPQSNPVANVQVASTSDKIARGEKLAHICEGCHSSASALPLDGSASNFAALGGPIVVGDLYPPNLTPGGPLKDWSDGEIIRAIREGVHKNGRGLLIMPSEQFHAMSDADVQSVVAYLRSQPAVQHDLPDNNLNVLGAMFIGAGVFPLSVQPPNTQPVNAPPTGTAEYGNYLITLSACRVCHGENLAGGTPGGFTPVGPNLTTLVPKWSEADFVKTIRTGVNPSGHPLDPDQMPWKQISAGASDTELSDIYKYLHALTPLTK
jgi:mono/diheme cytochrome c family protein